MFDSETRNFQMPITVATSATNWIVPDDPDAGPYATIEEAEAAPSHAKTRYDFRVTFGGTKGTTIDSSGGNGKFATRRAAEIAGWKAANEYARESRKWAPKGKD